MIKSILRAKERGHTKTDWLDSYHVFSFGDYHNPKHSNFGKLQVLNDDTVKPASGFAPHHHHNMEIISIILKGQLQHQDSEGHKLITNAGEVQVMSAGKGIQHSEINPSKTEPAHFLQLWIAPAKTDIAPHYQHSIFTDRLHMNHWACLASGNGWHDSLLIHQDAYVYLAEFEKDYVTAYELKNAEKNGFYCYVIEGSLTVAGEKLQAGDSIGITGTTTIEIAMDKTSRFVAIEVSM